MSKYYNISNTNFYLQCNSYLSEFLWIGWIQTDPKIRRITTPKKALTIGWPACRWHLRTSFQEAGTTLWRCQSLCLGDPKHPGESPQCHGLREHSGDQKRCSKKFTLRSLQLEVVLHEWSPLPGGVTMMWGCRHMYKCKSHEMDFIDAKGVAKHVLQQVKQNAWLQRLFKQHIAVTP